MTNKDNKIRASYTKEVENIAENHEFGYSTGSIPIPVLPKYKNVNYIGVEVECLINADDEYSLVTYLLMHNLQDKVCIGHDGSITETGNLSGIEIKLLTTEKTYKADLFNLSECLRLVNAEVNRSCGLHVHLDCHNISPDTIISNLSKYKEFFKSLVPKHRQDNTYTKFNASYNEHYNWINKTQHGTVEVRCHEGTVNMKAVERFINLLLVVKQTKVSKSHLNNVNKLMKLLKLTKTDSEYFLKRIQQFSKPKGDQYYV